MSDPRFLDGWLHSRPEPRHSNSLQVRLDAPDGITYAPDQTDPHTASRRLFVVPSLPEPASSLYSFQDEIIGYERATQKSVFVIGEDECDTETDAQKLAADYRAGNLQSRQADHKDRKVDDFDSDGSNNVEKTMQDAVATLNLDGGRENDNTAPTQESDRRSEDAPKSHGDSESGDKESKISQDVADETIERETTGDSKSKVGLLSGPSSQKSVVPDEERPEAPSTEESEAVSTSKDEETVAIEGSEESLKEQCSEKGDETVSTTSKKSAQDSDLVSESQNEDLAEDEPSDEAHGNDGADNIAGKHDSDNSSVLFVAKSKSSKSDRTVDHESVKSSNTSPIKTLQDKEEANEALKDTSTSEKKPDEFLSNKEKETELEQSSKAEVEGSESSRSQSSPVVSEKQVAGAETEHESKSSEAVRDLGSPKNTSEAKDIEEATDSVDATKPLTDLTSTENKTSSLRDQARDVSDTSDRKDSVPRGLETPNTDSNSSSVSSRDATLNPSRNERTTDSVASDAQKSSATPNQRSAVQASTEANDNASLRSTRSHAPSVAPSVAPTISRMTLESSMNHSKTPVLPKPVRENFTEYSFRPPASQLGKQYATHIWDAPKYSTLRATESLVHQPEGNDAGSQWERVSGYDQSGSFQLDAQFDISLDTISKLFVADPRKWHSYRFVCRTDPRQLLLLVAGQCLSEEQVRAALSKRKIASRNTNDINYDSERSLASYFGTLENSQAQGGIGVVLSPSKSLCESLKQPFDQDRAETNLSRRLEQPEFPNTTTTQRAALRSVIAALEYVQWEKEGFDKLVIAVHNAWIVRGISHDIWTWRKNGWVLTRKTPQGFPGEQVPNRDLWELLDYLVRQWEDIDGNCRFWHIPKQVNTEAVSLAEQGAVRIHLSHPAENQSDAHSSTLGQAFPIDLQLPPPHLRSIAMAAQRRGDDSGATDVPGAGGLSSLRYQALNKDSYRLDSPPFTGAAVSGAGPVTQGLENPVMNRANTAAGQSRERTLDRDVPSWNLSHAQKNKSASPDELDEELDASGLIPYPQEVTRSPHMKAIPRQGQSMDTYTFPRHRFSTQMRDESKQPLVVVACGSFSPPTYLHLYVELSLTTRRMFEMAKDQVIENGEYELLAGYYSPVSDQYKKAGLAKATHRVRMCELAVERSSNWLMVDAWESLQGEYQRTAIVLDHFNEEINGKNNDKGLLLSDGKRKPIKIMLLAGGDLIQSMGEPGVWADTDLHHILGRYGCLIVERTGADVWSFLLSHDLLWQHRRNLIVVKQTIYNDISSSKVRLFVRRGYSIKYLLPNTVIQYIEQNRLYQLSE